MKATGTMENSTEKVSTAKLMAWSAVAAGKKVNVWNGPMKKEDKQNMLALSQQDREKYSELILTKPKNLK